MKGPRHTGRAIGTLLFVLGCASMTAGTARAGELEEILVAFDQAQTAVHTLSADFVQTTTNPLLKDPMQAEGKFFMTKPDAIRWEYATPEVMSFVIANDRYTGYYPARKRAEKKNVQRYSQKIFRYFGLGQLSSDLIKAYEITLAAADSDGVHLLVLEPKKRRARKRVEEVRFWLDAKSYLPVKVEYTGSDGSSRTVEFDNIQVNPDLAASLYTVDLPSDVTVTKGFSGIPSLSPGAAQ
jgi:outer membrane lipoprotein-sorting protein